jgi:HlyD family secretion protein
MNDTPPLRRWTRYASALVALLLLPVLGCSQKETKTEPVVTVEATAAKREALDRIITAEALLYPIDQAAITPKISAPVAKFYVQRGAHVKKGELLATLENQDLAAAKSEMQGGYEQAQAAYQTTIHASLPEDIQKAELDVRAAKSNLDIQEKIYKSRQSLLEQGAIPRRDLEQAQVAYVQAQNAYNEAEKHLQSVQAVGEQQTKKSAAGQLASARAKYEGAAAQLSYSEIRSPISGVVTERPLYAGEMATAGTPLITVMDTSEVVARAHIPQDQAALLKVGDKAEIEGPDAIKLPGKVTVVSPALDPNSTTVEVWVQAANPKNTLKAGASVQVQINAGAIPDAIVIPASAVVPNTEGGGGDAVMVIGADGRAHRKAVKVGIRQDGQAQIVSGINPGDTVITSGGYGLPDNTQVKVAAASAPPSDQAAAPEKPE